MKHQATLTIPSWHVATGLLLIAFTLAATEVFNQPFLSWDESNYARLGLPPTPRQHPLQLLSISFMSAKPALPVTISLAYILFGINPWAPVLFSLWMGTVLLAVAYQWARRASGSPIGGWAAMAILGSTFFFNWFSRWRGPQNAQMLFVAVTGLCLLQWSRVGRKPWLSKAGFAAGIAVLYHYLSIYVVFATGLWLLLRNQNPLVPYADPAPLRERLRHAQTFASWCALPCLVAAMISVYRPARVDDAHSAPLGLYYVETLYWQVVELGGGRAADLSISDLSIYPHLIVYYEGIGAVALLALVEGYFILRHRTKTLAARSLLALMLYIPLTILIIWSAGGSDVRPRGLAMILPTAAVYIACGFHQFLAQLPSSARQPLVLASLLMVGTVIVGADKGSPLFDLHHPYYAIRKQVALRASKTLVGWKIKGGGMRPNEWHFLQRDLYSWETLIRAENISELATACEEDPKALVFVSGGRRAPDHPGIRLLAQFDNPIDRFIPTLLADGQNVELPQSRSRFLDQAYQGVRLFEFEHCKPTG